ncbi:pilus assembly protein TadG-related protein [Streptomyces sp. NPDC086080]|uniref:pilus assembly protein TadG-related protein n=1 Tax=Streptomyces sp. NPDC086080 TaxID=3365748 RepID=UPI0037D17195
MRRLRYGDAGQAFPIYLTVVGGLLFLAFAYFAVGQAAANRNDAQTAADAAALAAAQDRRDQLADAWVKNLLDPTKWQEIFGGDAEGLGLSCWRADQLAAQNEAVVLGCSQVGLLAYTVEVQTNDTVGDSVIPNTESMRSKASAKAVIKARCGFEVPGEAAEDDMLPLLICRGGTKWELDPQDPEQLLPKAADLFDVHLAD